MRFLRRRQISPAVANHTSVALRRTVEGLYLPAKRPTKIANPNNPMLPIAAPAASRAAASRPRIVPWSPAECFFQFRVSQPGSRSRVKIAGNARKRPPAAAPYLFAINPVTAVMMPPSKNLIAYSNAVVRRTLETSIETRMLYSGQ
jgi:hypothetical protein